MPPVLPRPPATVPRLPPSASEARRTMKAHRQPRFPRLPVVVESRRRRRRVSMERKITMSVRTRMLTPRMLTLLRSKSPVYHLRFRLPCFSAALFTADMDFFLFSKTALVEISRVVVRGISYGTSWAGNVQLVTSGLALNVFVDRDQVDKISL